MKHLKAELLAYIEMPDAAKQAALPKLIEQISSTLSEELRTKDEQRLHFALSAIESNHLSVAKDLLALIKD